MTFLAPGFFFASLAAAAAVVALHFVVTRQPRAGVLPTARFVPDLPANATARATRPSDLLLMLLRVLLVLAAGAGLAKPIVKPSRSAEARVILMDVSRSVSDSSAIRDSVRALYRNHDAVVVFDSSARVIAENAADSIRAAGFTRARGNLSAALVAAMRAGSSLRERADSIELVVVSPFAAEELDHATDSVRSLWKGRARLVTVRGGSADSLRKRQALEITSTASDPLQITVLKSRDLPGTTGLIVRSGVSDPASVIDRPLIQWPVAERPRFAIGRSVRDTIGGVTAGDALVVAAFERRWSYPEDSIRGSEVAARWIDGQPAALETATPTGCVRSVAVPVAAVGDLVIRRDFVRFVAALAGDCASRTAMRAADAQTVARLAGSGGLASPDAFRPRGDVRSDLAPWLLGFAIAAAIAELFVRRRQTAGATGVKGTNVKEKRAA
jgi:hypothetical protein